MNKETEKKLTEKLEQLGSLELFILWKKVEILYKKIQSESIKRLKKIDKEVEKYEQQTKNN